jgi:hypothetical protein
MDETHWTPRPEPPGGIPRCGACGSRAFQDLTPPAAIAGVLLKCLRCKCLLILAGRIAL